MIKPDLNLLAVFNVLYEVRSATRAAESLHLTQSAVSHSLRRLREMMNDPLFVRVGGTLQPTPRARAMAPGIREGLARLGTAVLPTGFDPETSTRTFTIAASTYFGVLIIPHLIVAARKHAPGVKFLAVPIRPDLLNHLDESTIDLAMGAFSRLPPRISSDTMLQDELVWVAAETNPLVHAGLKHAELAGLPHIGFDPVRTFTPMRSQGRDASEKPYLPERIIPVEVDGSEHTPAIVYDVFTAFAVVAASDLVALVPRQLALVERTRSRITIIPTQEAGATIELSMISRAEPTSDPGLEWLKVQILHLASTIRSH